MFSRALIASASMFALSSADVSFLTPRMEGHDIAPSLNSPFKHEQDRIKAFLKANYRHVYSNNKYRPHEGKQEKARRVRQMERQHAGA